MLLVKSIEIQAKVLEEQYKRDLASHYVMESVWKKLRHKPYSNYVPSWTPDMMYLYFRLEDVSKETKNPAKMAHIFMEEVCEDLDLHITVEFNIQNTDSGIDMNFMYGKHRVNICIFGKFAGCVYTTVKVMEETTKTIVRCR